jgi:hypothetical protein
MFFSHNKSANSTFSHDLSAKRTEHKSCLVKIIIRKKELVRGVVRVEPRRSFNLDLIIMAKIEQTIIANLSQVVSS